MTINIEFADHLDVRDLADIADAEYDIVLDRETDGDGRRTEDALETLDALQSMLRDLGMGYVTYPELSNTLRRLSVTTNPTLYAAGFFVEAMKEYVEDIGDLPSDLPSYVVIDWEATAAGLREGYSTVYLDGNEYLIRRA
jgi:hypothetical protein